MNISTWQKRTQNASGIGRQDQNLLMKCRNIYMIGRPRRYDWMKPTSTGSIQMFIDPLCDDPAVIARIGMFNESPSDNYIAFDRSQNVSVLPPNYDLSSFETDEKMDELAAYYENQLIIFHPSYTYVSRENRWYKNMLFTGFAKDDIDHYFSFVSVPKAQMDGISFEQCLRRGEYFDLLDYDGELLDPPEVVLCGSFAYRIKDAGGSESLFCPNSNDFERWKCTDYEKIVKIDLSSFDTYKSRSIRATEGIYFIEETLFSEILRSEEYVPMEEDRPRSIPEVLKADGQNQNRTAEEVIEEEQEEILNDEVKFLSGLQQQTLDNGLQYKYADLVNFHISVKTNPLTILAGMSGTGKSRLAMNYAKMLNLSEDNSTLLFLPISPSYTEPSDVLGYLNSMNGLYVPSETGFVQFLIHAGANPDQMHMVIFDEMNLSQIEYWFSPFLSILEKDMNERKLRLYDEDARCINQSVYPPLIRIGENIIFVGTVNIDDTTKDFSNRLLDRTFVISLDMVNFSQFYKDYVKHEGNSTGADVAQYKCKNVSQFMSWNKTRERNYMDAFHGHTRELEFFDQLNALIKKYIPDGGISHRVLKNIGNYILNVPVENNAWIMDREEVFDTVLNQTVMTKIRGTETQLMNLIGYSENGKIRESELMDLLDQYNDLSEFRNTRRNIFRKAEELRINGYTN